MNLTLPPITPGPWSIESMREQPRTNPGSWREIGPCVVLADWFTRNGEEVSGVKIKQDNARAIATVPDLLDALMTCAQFLPEAAWALRRTNMHNGADEAGKVLEKVCAALVKAGCTETPTVA